jgi:Cellulase N-terminal ig-like domain
MRRAWLTLLAATGVTLAAVIPAAAPASAAALAPPQARVNQVGYPADGPKVAFAMLPRKVASVRFEVVTPYGVAYRGVSADDVGAWNANYRAVYTGAVAEAELIQAMRQARAFPVSPRTLLADIDGMRACSAGHFAPFNTKAAAYEDNVVSWPSVEPADDYTANSLMAFALGAAGLG